MDIVDVRPIINEFPNIIMEKDVYNSMNINVCQIYRLETKNRFQKVEIVDNMIARGNILQYSGTCEYNNWNDFQR